MGPPIDVDGKRPMSVSPSTRMSVPVTDAARATPAPAAVKTLRSRGSVGTGNRARAVGAEDVVGRLGLVFVESLPAIEAEAGVAIDAVDAVPGDGVLVHR